MSQIAPDIPELSNVPDVVRPFVWTQAMMRAICSPVTLGLALVVVIALASAGAVGGAQAAGLAGRIAGGLLGTIAGGYVFLRFLVHWQARRLVPIVLKERDWNTELGDLVRLQEKVRIVGEKAQREP
jgi:hypothetical protein